MNTILMNLGDLLIGVRGLFPDGHFSKDNRSVFLDKPHLILESSWPVRGSFCCGSILCFCLNVIMPGIKKIPDHLDICMHRKVNRDRATEIGRLNMAVFFHECGQYTKKVMNIYPQIIIVFGKLIPNRKIDRHSVCVSFHTNKTVALTIFIDMTHLAKGDVTPFHVIINVWKYPIYGFSISQLCCTRHKRSPPSLMQGLRFEKKIPY